MYFSHQPMDELLNLQRKVLHYQEILQNTLKYRAMWENSTKRLIKDTLQGLIDKVQLPATLEERNEINNLCAIVVNLGIMNSGLGEPVGGGLMRDLIKQNGSLVYQQLFNGKVLVLINYPFIEKYGQPQPPKTIAIYRPEELKAPYFERHLETFMQELINWEDYDDDLPEPNQRIGFKMNFEQQNQPQ
ncbi:MAG: hypothetical protein KGS48_02000 [Bacteroidetes bacterium]|nr:hypothetical protein [Bacteroidota bacterium]